MNGNLHGRAALIQAQVGWLGWSPKSNPLLFWLMHHQVFDECGQLIR
jgi:hypothetical protein